MTQQISYSDTNVDQKIDHEQFNQIVEAILAGKYSWACFLLLRCTGYNPLNYIPYRTYNRLVKENSQIPKTHSDKQCSKINSNGTTSRKHLNSITDLDYIETVGEEDKRVQQIRGGYLSRYLEHLLFNLQE